ncbi:MAG: hypothetical protein JRF18_05835 [Deltaproteobacteria bacterium]|nr:hypothetical protein [Deltaproteobacteria bacterium]
MNGRDPLRENVLKINKLAHRCKIILQGLIDFANNEDLEMSPVDVNRTIRDVVGFIEDHVLFKGISIENHLDPALPNVKGDESKLGQLFMNLIINAGESMGGQGTLTLSTDLAPETNDVRIACSDTGGGIADEHKGRIFEPFFTTKKRLKGTGMGLSISHGIVELHGGTITVQSDRGHGSTFTVFLPTPDGRPALLSDRTGTL